MTADAPSPDRAPPDRAPPDRAPPDRPAPPPSRREDARPVVLVTGPSGAGRTTAIRALEDLGFEAIDNLPLSLVPRLLDGPPRPARLALGVDARTRDFSTAALIELLEHGAGAVPGSGFELLYLDCSAEVLLRRFSETRRRHPLAPAEAPAAGIEREFDLLAPARARADILIDTTEMTLHELRAEVARWYGGPSERRLALSVQSFSYKRGLPRGIDMAFDCRFLRNPYWDDTLRDRDGRDPEVAAFVAADPRHAPFFDKVAELTHLLLPAYVEEGKSHLTIGFGCTGGKHRSVAVAEALVNTLAAAGWGVSIRHRELERRAAGATGQASVQASGQESAQASGDARRGRAS